MTQQPSDDAEWRANRVTLPYIIADLPPGYDVVLANDGRTFEAHLVGMGRLSFPLVIRSGDWARCAAACIQDHAEYTSGYHAGIWAQVQSGRLGYMPSHSETHPAWHRGHMAGFFAEYTLASVPHEYHARIAMIRSYYV